MTAIPLQPLRIPVDRVSAERIDGDVIAVNLEVGSYFSMSGTAADVWTAASSGTQAEEWLSVLDREYGFTCPREAIGRFIAECLSNGLLVEGEGQKSAGVGLPNDWDRNSWTAPRLEIFEDLRDLLLVDPVHEASVFGWPNAEGRGD
jgi:hypothetical protein